MLSLCRWLPPWGVDMVWNKLDRRQYALSLSRNSLMQLDFFFLCWESALV